MDPRTFPTKGNLMLAKNSLALAQQGYDLMDKKRNILIRELMDLIDEARNIQDEIDTTFTYAYQCLQRANIENGISMVEQLAYTVPIENSITIQTRSIMGTEIPHVKYVPDAGKPTYSFSTTHESIDKAREAFRKVKDLTIKLSNGGKRSLPPCKQILRKTQKRANALQNITIPMYSSLVYNDHQRIGRKRARGFTRLKDQSKRYEREKGSPPVRAAFSLWTRPCQQPRINRMRSVLSRTHRQDACVSSPAYQAGRSFPVPSQARGLPVS